MIYYEQTGVDDLKRPYLTAREDRETQTDTLSVKAVENRNFYLSKQLIELEPNQTDIVGKGAVA